MKKLTTSIFVVLIIFGFSACKTTSNSSDKNSDNQHVNDISGEGKESDEPADGQEESPTEEQNASTVESISGSELVSRITSKLESVLTLSSEQSTKTRKIMEGELIGSGRSLTSSIPVNEIKSVTSEVIINGQGSLMAILEGEQVEKFSKFVSRLGN